MAKYTKKGVDLEEAKRLAPQGINYLLAIAIDAYQACPRLYNCVGDAQALIELFTERYYFDRKHIITLFNEEASKGNIYDAFSTLAGMVTSKDNLLIYFS